jgi:hypothetical protein
MLFLVVGRASAKIVPVRATFSYSPSAASIPAMTVKAEDGTVAYELTLESGEIHKKGHTFHLVLRRASARRNGRNLLEPKRWHGPQAFMFIAWDFAGGLEKSTFGAVRAFHIENQEIDVRCKVTKAEVRPTANPPLSGDYVFNELVLEVETDNSR